MNPEVVTRSSPSLDLETYKSIVDTLDEGVYVTDSERRILYWNEGAEKISGFTKDEVLGRRCADNILVHVDAEGRSLCDEGCPLAATLADGEPRHLVAFLRHKGGHRVPVSIRSQLLTDSDGRLIGIAETFSNNTEHMTALEQIDTLERLAYIDPMTQIANRRFLESGIHARLQEINRFGWGFGLLFMDIDHFKQVNDAYGHDSGDKVLRTIARTMLSVARAHDLLGRWGGEEFIAVVANVAGRRLLSIAERFRMIVGRTLVAVEGTDGTAAQVNPTISVGAARAVLGDTVDSLVARADKLMYQSKQNGRNRSTAEE